MKKKSTAQKSLTDFKKLDSLKDKGINFSDCPEITSAMLAKAVVRKGLKKKSKTNKK